MLLLVIKTNSKATLGNLLTVQHLCDLRDAVSHDWSPGTPKSNPSATDLLERFLPSDFFYLVLLSTFQGFPWMNSLTLKLAGLHAVV